MKKIFILLIRIYQVSVSPDHSLLGKSLGFRVCRFHPTCSEYTLQAIEKYGLIRGLTFGLKRISKCHPFHPGGVDELTDSIS